VLPVPLGFMAPPVAVVAAALLLDGIAASVKGAFSLRMLRAAYNGPAVRVRRASDSAEQDIGFASGALNTAALLAFCGTGDGFVSKWYDQSGLGQDMAQAVTSQQPQIVAAGSDQTSGLSVVQTLGNAAARPAMVFAAAQSQQLANPAFALLAASAYASASVAARTATTPGYERLLSFTGAGQNDDYSNGASVIFAAYNGGLLGYQGGARSSAPVGTAPFQAASVWTGTAHTMMVDGAAGAPAPASGTLGSPGWLGIGARSNGGSDVWDGPHAEHLIIAGSLSGADQATIRASQQAFYGTP